MMRITTMDLVAATVGAAGAVAADRAAMASGPRGRVVSLSLGLAGAAAVYPLSRTRFTGDRRAVARELVALASYGAAGAVAVRRAETDGHLIAGTGWLLHAVFDAVHGDQVHSHLPRWYPALCAGFDVALAVRMVALPRS